LVDIIKEHGNQVNIVEIGWKLWILNMKLLNILKRIIFLIMINQME
jgi:hypothetical protein